MSKLSREQVERMREMWMASPDDPEWDHADLLEMDAVFDQALRALSPAPDSEAVRRLREVRDWLSNLDKRIDAHLARQSAAQPEGQWVSVPNDLLSHIGDWRSACEIAKKLAEETVHLADASYWRHQLATLDNIQATLRASEPTEGGA